MNKWFYPMVICSILNLAIGCYHVFWTHSLWGMINLVAFFTCGLRALLYASSYLSIRRRSSRP
jgi:hypothetical protein